jgi:hypothetical protein
LRAFLHGELGVMSQRAQRDTVTLMYYWHLVNANHSRQLSRLFWQRLRAARARDDRDTIGSPWCTDVRAVFHRYGLCKFWVDPENWMTLTEPDGLRPTDGP